MSAEHTAAAALPQGSSQGQGRPKRAVDDDDNGDDLHTKRPRQHEEEEVDTSEPAPLYLFATTSDIQARRNTRRDHWSRKQCLTLREIMGIGDYNDESVSMGPIEFIFVANYIINFEFLLDEVPELLSLPRACVVYGSKEGSEDSWRQACTTVDGRCSVDFLCRNPAAPARSASNPLPQQIPYGVHHTKLFLIGFATGSLRVVIHTANLRYSDIHLKAQGAYLQDFPRKNTGVGSVNVATEFEDSLVNYMESYGYDKKYKWDGQQSSDDATTLAQHLRKFDFSSALVTLIPSVPGNHKINDNIDVGHLKLRKEIERLCKQQHNMKSNDNNTRHVGGPIICQFSSLGSLTKKYLHRLAYSMDIVRSRGTSGSSTDEDDESKPLNLHLVYPTSDEICNSLEGYRGGASVPGNSKNVSKDFLRPLYRKWTASKSFLASLSFSKDKDDANSNPLWKGSNVPHIKTYFQLQDDNDDALEWFVLTSHNMSKAAWGDVQNSTAHGEKRLFVRHWEMGVLVSPHHLRAKRLVPWTAERATERRPAGEVTLPLPYRHKPLPYTETDKPWAVDERYARLDIFGRRSAQDP